jgi:hypothetical protein
MPRRRADDAADHVSFLYQPRARLWDSWKRGVPRDTALYARLDALLAYDRRYDLDTLVADDDGSARIVRDPTAAELVDAVADDERLYDALDAIADDDSAESIGVTAVRIRRRCASGVQDARANDADTAAEALTEIKQLAEAMLERE